MGSSSTTAQLGSHPVFSPPLARLVAAVPSADPPRRRPLLVRAAVQARYLVERVQRVPLLVEFLIVAALAVCGLLVARRLRRTDPSIDLDNALKRAPLLYLILVVVALLGGVRLVAYFVPHLARSLPLWLEFSFNAVIWGGVFAVFSFGFTLTVTLAFATGHARRWSLAIASVGLLMIVELVQAEYTRPIAPQLRELERDGVVLQSSGVSCVSASAANLLRLHGVRRTERQMAERLGASGAGATTAQLLYGLEREGLSCQRLIRSDGNVMAVKPPAIVFYGDRGGVPHAVVLAERNGRRVTILDPLSGRGTMNVAQLSRIWDGEAVHCKPSSMSSPQSSARAE